MEYPPIIPYTSVDLEDVECHPLTKKTHLLTSLIRYHHNPLLIQGPRMFLGSEIRTHQGYYYIDLIFDPVMSKLVIDLDASIIAEIFANSSQWYPELQSEQGEQISITQIEQEFIPSIKRSTIYKDRQSLKLKIPTTRIEIYDQDDLPIPVTMIKSHFRVIPLLHMKAVCRDDSRLWIEWDLPQLKVIVPPSVFTSCQLVTNDDPDDVGSSDEDTIPDTEDL